MGTLYREATSIFVFTILFNWSQFLKKNTITHLGFFKSGPLSEGPRHPGRQVGSQKLIPFVETATEHACAPMHLNSTSITMSKWRRYYV